MVLSAVIIFLVFLLLFALVVVFDILDAKRRKEKYKLSRAITALLFLLPAVTLAFFFVLLPILYSLGYSFTNYNLLKPNNIRFVGFDNFVEAFQEIGMGGKLALAIKNTAIFVVLVVPIQIILALLLALFCNTKYRGSGIFKVCFFVPVAISLTITSYLWLQILSDSPSGMLNSFLGMFGIEAQRYLSNPDMTMVWIVVLSAWQGCGYQMLIFLSALTGIRKDLYEAARMDGCNAWQRFIKVTLPGLRPTMLYILITVFIGACRIMIQPMLMVGYQDNAITISYYMYQQGYSYRFVGYSSAIALLMTIFIGTITLVQRKILGEKK